MRYTVLTYIFGGYEQVHEIGEKDPDAEYILVTDDPNLKSDTWQVIHDPMPRHSVFGKCYEVRFHPFRYAKTSTVIRVDGSIEVRKPLTVFVDELERGNYDRCMMIHPHRDNFPKEYDVWVRYRSYPREQAAKCLTLMERMGYDFGYRGMFQGCFEVVKDTPVNRDVNDMTFGLLCALATNGKIERIDQTVTSFVLNRFFADRISILPVCEDIITDGNLMRWYLHHSKRPIPLKKDTIQPMMFNREVEVWKPQYDNYD